MLQHGLSEKDTLALSVSNPKTCCHASVILAGERNQSNYTSPTAPVICWAALRIFSLEISI
jgi:hypothetical protein